MLAVKPGNDEFLGLCVLTTVRCLSQAKGATTSHPGDAHKLWDAYLWQTLPGPRIAQSTATGDVSGPVPRLQIRVD